LHQALLGAEVVGDQRLRLPGRGGHLRDRQAGVAVRLQDVDRGLEDPLAGAGGRPSPAGGSRSRWCWGHAAASIAGSRPIAASFFESDFAAYSKISLEW